MEYLQNQILKEKLTTLTIKDFIDKYNPGLSSEAIRVAILNDKLDYYRPSRDYFVVVNQKSIDYSPNEHKNRIT